MFGELDLIAPPAPATGHADGGVAAPPSAHAFRGPFESADYGVQEIWVATDGLRLMRSATAPGQRSGSPHGAGGEA